MKHKHRKRGRPKDIARVVLGDNPDDYPSLLAYLEAKGQIKHISQVQMYRAKFLYMRGYSLEQIANAVHLEPPIIDRWAVLFGWDEERDKRLFEQFRKLNTVSNGYGGDLAQRHERIAASIEQAAERILEKGNGQVNPKDLSTIANVLKTTQDIRRTARGVAPVKGSGPENSNNTFNVLVGDPSKVVDALSTIFDRPKLVEQKSTTMAVGMEERIGRDTEFE